MNRILVTGASGNVGKEVVKELLKLNRSVSAAVSSKDGESQFPEGVKTVRLDFDDQSSFNSALDGVDKVFLLRPPIISEVEKFLFPFIDTCLKAGIKHIVFLSLQGVAFNPFTPHFKVERYLKKLKTQYTFIRPNFFMQNLSTFYKDDIKIRNEIFLPAGRGKTAFVDTRDIGAVAAKVLAEENHYGKAYTLTGPEALDYYEVANIFSRILGKKVTYTNPSVKQYTELLRKNNASEDYIKVQKMLYFVVRHNFSKGITQTIPQILGRPALSMENFVKDFTDVWA